MLSQLNIKTFNLINQFAGRNHFLDSLIVFLAQYLPVFFVLLLFYLWFKFKKDSYKRIILMTGYSAILGILSNILISLFYFHPRPFMDNIGTLLINHIPETSFPSDHTTFMLSIAFMFLYFKEMRWLGFWLSVLGLLGGFSRVFCGVHYPFDIIGSVFVAIVSSFTVYSLRNRLKVINNFIIILYRKIFC